MGEGVTVTVGEWLSSLSSVFNVSALEHIKNISQLGSTFIPSTSLDSDIVISEFETDFISEEMDGDITIESLECDLIMDEYSSDLVNSNLEGDIS